MFNFCNTLLIVFFLFFLCIICPQGHSILTHTSNINNQLSFQAPTETATKAHDSDDSGSESSSDVSDDHIPLAKLRKKQHSHYGDLRKKQLSFANIAPVNNSTVNEKNQVRTDQCISNFSSYTYSP